MRRSTVIGVVAAAIADISIAYRGASGDSGLLRAMNRLAKEEEMRIARGVKPPSAAPDGSLVSATPSFVGSGAR